MLIEVINEIPFSQVDNDLIIQTTEAAKNIKQIEKSILLLFYLEYKYHKNHGYASPSTERINEIIKCNNKTLKNIIRVLHNNLIVEFCQGKRVEGKIRTRNRYIPNTRDSNTNKRRYRKHKSRSYFFDDVEEES